jgi:hypothetical protein
MFSQENGVKAKCGFFRQPLKASSQVSVRRIKTRRITDRTRHAYAQERAKQKEHLDNERAGLDELLNCGSIDEETQIRFVKLLEMSYEKKREETREKYGFRDVFVRLDSDINP